MEFTHIFQQLYHFIRCLSSIQYLMLITPVLLIYCYLVYKIVIKVFKIEDNREVCQNKKIEKNEQDITESDDNERESENA